MFTITVDNVVIQMMLLLPTWKRNSMLRDLVFVNGLKQTNNLIKKVRDAIRHIRQSSNRLQKFKSCYEIERIESKNSLCSKIY